MPRVHRTEPSIHLIKIFSHKPSWTSLPIANPPVKLYWQISKALAVQVHMSRWWTVKWGWLTNCSLSPLMKYWKAHVWFLILVVWILLLLHVDFQGLILKNKGSTNTHPQTKREKDLLQKCFFAIRVASKHLYIFGKFRCIHHPLLPFCLFTKRKNNIIHPIISKKQKPLAAWDRVKCKEQWVNTQ